MENPNLDVHCLTCGAKPGERCRTLKTRRITDIHAARWNDRHYIALQRKTAAQRYMASKLEAGQP